MNFKLLASASALVMGVALSTAAMADVSAGPTNANSSSNVSSNATQNGSDYSSTNTQLNGSATIQNNANTVTNTTTNTNNNLGLSITEAIMAAHGGSVTASSSNGITTFCLVFPGSVAD